MPNPVSTSLAQTVNETARKIANYESRPERVNESNTIRALITPMIAELGWDIHDLDEVQSEYRHRSTDNPVDYALFLDGDPVLFIEAKALPGKLDDRKWIVQTLNYANACNVEWAVLTNGAEWRVYNVHAKVEAERKLFYAVHIDGTDVSETARRLSFLSRTSMAPKRALDQIWREASVDRAMRDVIEDLPDNRAAVRAMAKASRGLSEKDIRDALRRLGLRADWRDEDDLFPARSDVSCQQTDVDSPDIDDDQTSRLSQKAIRKATSLKHIRLPDIHRSGLLATGDRIRLRPYPDEIATVIDGRFCDYRGQKMSYNAWGCAVTGWVSIQIYSWAETMDGILLQDLRQICNQMIRDRTDDSIANSDEQVNPEIPQTEI